MRYLINVVLLLLASFANAAEQELLINNGFESGRNTGWATFYDSPGATTSAEIVDLSYPYAGSWYAYLGDRTTTSTSARGHLVQSIHVPPLTTRLTLRFRMSIASADSTTRAFDQLEAVLLDSDGVKVASFGEWDNRDQNENDDPADYQAYRERINNADKFSEKDLILQFYASTDQGLYTTFRIDDVSLIAETKDTPPQYAISVLSDEHGSVDPSGVILINGGNSLTLTASPAEGYKVKYWILDGESVGVGSLSYEFADVQKNHAIKVIFEENLHRISIVVEGSGTYTLDPSVDLYRIGTKVMLAAFPAEGQEFSEWTGGINSRSPDVKYTVINGDNSIRLRFVPVSLPPSMHLAFAGNSRELLHLITIPQPDWITFFEKSVDLLNWFPVKILLNEQGSHQVDVVPGPDNVGFVRGTPFPAVSTAPFLQFPIKGVTPQDAKVVSIMDHERLEKDKNGRLVLSGIKSDVVYNHDWNIKTVAGRYYQVPLANRGKGNYAPLPEGDVVSSAFDYVGYGPEGGRSSLQYDGHPGYDFGYADKEVYCAAPGEVLLDSDLEGTNLEGTGIVATYMAKYHALIVYHQTQGYCTVYMHLSDVNKNYVDKSDPEAWKPKRATIDMEKPIGETGNKCKPCQDRGQVLGEHLHFEVWRRDGQDWNYADPYGEPLTPDGPIQRLWQ